MAEEVTKTVDGTEYPAGDFLVVEDPESPSTWHLQVKRNGEPDHGLMGAAWAALHGGYRGNRYAGPQKTEALAKLKALYGAEDMEMPAESAEGDLGAALGAILAQVQALAAQVQALYASVAPAAPEEPEAPAEPAPEAEPTPATEALAESLGGATAVLAEATPEPDALTMHVRLIKPGFGNPRDGHYYGADMLRRDAGIFAGSKMYETDHRPDEKSTRTWVSTVRNIVGWDEGPIAEVVVHDPDFAQRVRNLQATGLLGHLECSILADGEVAPPRVIEGRTAKEVLALRKSPQTGVDWVTRAGAGGAAVAVAEAATDEAPPVLPAAAVGELLAATALPAATVVRLLAGEYRDAAAVQAAVQQELASLKRETGSGRPFGSGKTPTARRPTLQELNERQDAVNAKYLK